MKIEIIAKNYEAATRLKEIIEKKLEKFERYFDSSDRAKVILKKINEDKFAMEITINFDGGKVIRSEVISDNMYDNIDLVLPKMERQIRKFRTKLDKKYKYNSAQEDALLYPEIDVKEPELVKKKVMDLARLTPIEAMDSLYMVDHDFYIFINSEDDDKVCVIYRRKDGNIGLISLNY